MNNEPVAWMYERPNGSAKLTFVREPMAGTVVIETPLYTHPAEHDLGIAEAIGFDKGYKSASVKELTDEEIGQFKGEWYRGDYASFYDLVRAILRKAQEK